jgi:hypothetical protein
MSVLVNAAVIGAEQSEAFGGVHDAAAAQREHVTRAEFAQDSPASGERAGVKREAKVADGVDRHPGRFELRRQAAFRGRADENLLIAVAGEVLGEDEPALLDAARPDRFQDMGDLDPGHRAITAGLMPSKRRASR